MIENIWKLNIPVRATLQKFQLPFGSKIVHCAEDPKGHYPTIWFMFELDDETQTEVAYVERSFLTLPTGAEKCIPCADYGVIKYVGTCVMQSGLVWHIYEQLQS